VKPILLLLLALVCLFLSVRLLTAGPRSGASYRVRCKVMDRVICDFVTTNRPPPSTARAKRKFFEFDFPPLLISNFPTRLLSVQDLKSDLARGSK